VDRVQPSDADAVGIRCRGRPGETRSSCRKLLEDRAQRALVYVGTVAAAEECDRARRGLLSRPAGCGGCSRPLQEDFTGEVTGRGGDVRFRDGSGHPGTLRRVIHYQPAPAAWEAWDYQEAGRAGRDGRPAECTLSTKPGRSRPASLSSVEQSGLGEWLAAQRPRLSAAHPVMAYAEQRGMAGHARIAITFGRAGRGDGAGAHATNLSWRSAPPEEACAAGSCGRARGWRQSGRLHRAGRAPWANVAGRCGVAGRRSGRGTIVASSSFPSMAPFAECKKESRRNCPGQLIRGGIWRARAPANTRSLGLPPPSGGSRGNAFWSPGADIACSKTKRRSHCADCPGGDCWSGCARLACAEDLALAEVACPAYRESPRRLDVNAIRRHPHEPGRPVSAHFRSGRSSKAAQSYGGGSARRGGGGCQPDYSPWWGG